LFVSLSLGFFEQEKRKRERRRGKRTFGDYYSSFDIFPDRNKEYKRISVRTTTS
jgi:hypothetical protein